MAIHEKLANGGWRKLSFAEQMGNIGAEVARAQGWEIRGDLAKRDNALLRALELIDFTIGQDKIESHLKEEFCDGGERLASFFKEMKSKQ
jgi:hypothetical protein